MVHLTCGLLHFLSKRALTISKSRTSWIIIADYLLSKVMVIVSTNISSYFRLRNIHITLFTLTLITILLLIIMVIPCKAVRAMIIRSNGRLLIHFKISCFIHSRWLVPIWSIMNKVEDPLSIRTLYCLGDNTTLQ